MARVWSLSDSRIVEMEESSLHFPDFHSRRTETVRWMREESKTMQTGGIFHKKRHLSHSRIIIPSNDPLLALDLIWINKETWTAWLLNHFVREGRKFDWLSNWVCLFLSHDGYHDSKIDFFNYSYLWYFDKGSIVHSGMSIAYFSIQPACHINTSSRWPPSLHIMNPFLWSKGAMDQRRERETGPYLLRLSVKFSSHMETKLCHQELVE